jgi:hypothetical protein
MWCGPSGLRLLNLAPLFAGRGRIALAIRVRGEALRSLQAQHSLIGEPLTPTLIGASLSEFSDNRIVFDGFVGAHRYDARFGGTCCGASATGVFHEWRSRWWRELSS